ncbi:MAG: SPFH domain-containing protein [Moorea sp. SIO3I7]|uniref:SPFH domain-containing protein n=1 Tax=unclassified Moorena TaxID=2683338 RepID=UPI0013BED43E|nr:MULTISPECIES: SPFH domain-containing protein [unclassified Moorena]NEN99247.1 SPFH domain-containing protein [Moorena sp. SIO3I7]NEO06119.1 SPFH domain-containing protein [Moorena sp. SIO3I8]NEO22676.1 SPFH domain-containing protein [Moorena sp. SIO4A5]NEQ60225.1 SPFH domain-containing protein [Moorena sp. SIO4A1]
MERIQEIPTFKINGFAALVGIIAIASFGVWLGKGLVGFSNINDLFLYTNNLFGIGLVIVALVAVKGFLTVQPNQARVLVFLGSYVGSVRTSGFWWVNPFASKQLVSLRVRNFNSEKLKVNDAKGNPIEIAAVVVWRVVDSAKATFDVNSYVDFVAIQSETAIRGLASRYPYDTNQENLASLRGSPEEIAAALKEELQARLEVSGVEVIDSRISYLAYAPEIAQVMLRRQQAQAIIAARQEIIEGALSMVEMSIKRLNDHQIIELDEETKAAMINNLLVVLTAEQNIQPVVNTGSLKL